MSVSWLILETKTEIQNSESSDHKFIYLTKSNNNKILSHEPTCSHGMLLHGAILLALIFELVCSEDVCPYLDFLRRRKYRTCDSGCCGDLNNAYCCQHKYLSVIILGSVVGFFLLVAVVVVIIHCCYRRRFIKFKFRRVTRNYGSISVPDGAREGPRNSPEVHDEVIVPEVAITVTPATPRVSVVHPIGEHSTITTIIEESLKTNGAPATANHSVTLEAEISTIEETPESITETEDTMGNENKPAGRVDNDVQPYYPDNRPYPDNQPYVPDTEPYVPDVQPYSPDVQPYNPAGRVDTDVQPYYPDNQPYRPDNQPYIPDNQPYIPDNQPYIADNQPYIPDTEPYQPDVQPYTPDTQPYPDPTPAGMAERDDVEPYEPDTEPYIPDDEPYDDDPDNQPY